MPSRTNSNPVPPTFYLAKVAVVQFIARIEAACAELQATFAQLPESESILVVENDSPMLWLAQEVEHAIPGLLGDGTHAAPLDSIRVSAGLSYDEIAERVIDSHRVPSSTD